jgi:hypothetical protein
VTCGDGRGKEGCLASFNKHKKGLKVFILFFVSNVGVGERRKRAD